jgi:hypothetical protein
MLNKLLVDDGYGHKFCISGHTMLRLAGQAVDAHIATGRSAPNGNGSYEQPWVLGGTASHWLAVTALFQRNVNTACYVEICGRYVHKSRDGFYMVDGGGVDGGQAWNQPYVRRTDRYRDGTVSHGSRSSGDFERGGPSYGQYMKRMTDQQQWNHKHLTNEAWSQAKATKLRRVLKADVNYAAKLSHKGDLHTGQLLPVLAATMFLAEPARNQRCFLINLMLLDMIELGDDNRGGPPFTWDLVMWNPEFDHRRGGMLPAAGTGSASAANIGDVLNFTQEKELDILLRYFSFGGFDGTSGPCPRGYTSIISHDNVPICPMPDRSKPRDLLGYLKYLMEYRLRSGFDY